MLERRYRLSDRRGYRDDLYVWRFLSDCCLAVPINPPCVWNIIQSVQLHFTPLASYLPAVVVVLYEKPALDYPTLFLPRAQRL